MRNENKRFAFSERNKTKKLEPMMKENIFHPNQL